MSAKDFRSSAGKPDGPRGQKKGKADWRTKGKMPAGRKPPQQGVGWTEKSGQQYQRAKFWYRIKIGGTIAILLAGLAVFIAVLLWQPKNTPFVALALTDYRTLESVLPPNGWAEEDLQRFGLLGSDKHILSYPPADYAIGESGVEGLKDLRQKLFEQSKPSRLWKKRKDLVVVYLSMHGVVDSEGRPCLLTPDASPYTADTWLPLAEVIEYLFPQDQRRQQPVNKLLILDCNRIDTNWRLGLLYNGFAEGLEDVLHKAKVPGLIILNSTSPGQVGWTSPGEFHGSVFGHYLWLGLAGQANGHGRRGKLDGRITLSELYSYLEANVKEWVLENRADRQRPLLVPADAKEIDVVFTKAGKPAFSAETSPGGDTSLEGNVWQDARWEDVAQLWKRHEKLQQGTARRLSPLRWAEFEHQLLRLEQLLTAGKAYQDRYAALERDLRDLAVQLGKDADLENVACYSLPLGSQLQPDADSRADSSGAGPAYRSAVEQSWQGFLNDPSGRKWPQLLATVDQAGRPAADVVELHFVRMLQRHLDPLTYQNGSGLVRLALSTRARAERAAAPQDVRAHYWAKPLVDQADPIRRQAEDRLFVGSPEELKEAQQDYRKIVGADGTGGTYGQAVQLGDQVQAAYAARDQARARIPFLAQWLLDRRYQPDATRLVELENDLKDLIDATDSLDNRLDESLGTANWPGELVADLETVQGKLDTLRDAIRRYTPPSGSPRIGRTLKAISVVLDTPLVTGDKRKQLRNDYLEIVREVDPELAAAGPEEKAGDASQNAAWLKKYLERISRFARHPALAALKPDHLEREEGSVRSTDRFISRQDVVAEKDPLAREKLRRKFIYRQGEEVRGLLAGLEKPRDSRNPIQAWIEETEEKLKARNQGSPAETRAGISRADRLIRAAAALMPRPAAYHREDSGGEPAQRLWRLDLYYLMLWHAYRSLEDFWGPRGDVSAAEPYFEIVTTDYLNSARGLIEATKLVKKTPSPFYQEPGPDGARVNLTELLAERSESSLQPAAEDLVVDKDESSAPSRLDVSVRWGQHLPKGRAAIYLVDPLDGQETITIPLMSSDREPRPDLRRTGIPVGDGETEVERRWVAAESIPQETNHLDVVALYRGHRETYQIGVDRLEGLLIQYQPPRYPDPKITVYGTATESYSIMFILDCSGSMDKVMRVTIDKKDVQVKRFEVAREKLIEILGRLAGRNDRYHVGLRVYGHRAGWAPDNRTIIAWDPEDPQETIADSSLHPANDTQLLLAPSSFQDIDYRRVREKLALLKPLGETPLYYAICEAVEDLRQAAESSKYHIVVVTDGVDDRSPDGGQGIFRTDVRKALGSLGREPVRLDVVGFRISEEDFTAEKRKKLDDLKQLASQTGGDFYPAQQPDDLVDVLARALQLSRYHVERKVDGRRITPSEGVSLGRATVIEQAPDESVRYRVLFGEEENLVSTEVELEGGESLKLYLTEDRSRLEHTRFYGAESAGRAYLEEVPNPDPERKADLDPSRFFLGARLPRRERDSVRFRFSVENQDQTKFSPRPAEAWVEVRPLLASGDPLDDHVYIFYDLKFEPDQPVPVLDYTALGWPDRATDAEVRLFCKLRRTEPNWKSRVDRLAGNVPFSVEGVDSAVAFELQTLRGESGGECRVVVQERHRQRGALGSVKVQMRPSAGQPAPNHVEHRFNYKTARVRHTFYYDDAAYERIGGYTVTFTSREALASEAIAPTEPLVVAVPPR